MRRAARIPAPRPAQPPPSVESLRAAAADIEAWASVVLGRPLRPYQTEVARAILDSVRHQRGLTITVMMARQMGKNEVSAILESYLLCLFRGVGGTIIKAAPTLRPQAVNSRRRSTRMLDNPFTRGLWELEASTILRLERAELHFISGGPTANVVGATADILLELDEAQNLDPEKIDRELRPMVASTNATRVYYGTAWTDSNPLEVQKRQNLELQAADGLRRHFEYPYEVLAALNPHYARFVEGEIARLGREHPTVLTQYFLKPTEDAGRLFPRAVRALLLGTHRAQTDNAEGAWLVAGIDVGGQDSALALGMLPEPSEGGRDATVISIGRVLWTAEHEPSMELVALYAWQGAAYDQQYALIEQLCRETYACARIVIDATGLGAAPAAHLKRVLGDRVEPYVFTGPSKSRLGYNLVAFAGTGRLKLFAEADEEMGRARARLLREIETARRDLMASEMMRWYVSASEGHDDHLTSLALCCYAAATAPPPPVSAVIDPAPDYQPPRSGRPFYQVW